jgi:3-isopropylmalate/(R)-2-methylmalate dehydratase large subunit
MRIRVNGILGAGITAKDLALAIIAHVRANGAAGHVVEFAGEAIATLPVEGRLTLCNMSIEAGARAGLIAPDETTLAYLTGRPFAPADAAWAEVARESETLRSDKDAVFDREVELEAGGVAPMVTWGTSPEDSVPITDTVPDPAALAEADRRDTKARALRYMDLRPGMKMTDIPIDRVFIGSCTNARLSDLREAAAVFRGRRAAVRTLVVPGSQGVKAAAEAEGLDRIFRDAGAEWREPGCSMCVGVNGDLLAEGERCAATSNRNFEGRQGPRGRTHLMSPAMAAAAAVSGRLADVRLLRAR